MKNDELQAAVFRFEKSVKAGNQSLKKGKANGIPMGRAEIEFHKDMTLALTALRDVLQRQDGCDVCNHDGFDEMVCYIPTENGDGLMVMSNYCPNCGCEISKQAIKYGAGYVDQDILRSAT